VGRGTTDKTTYCHNCKKWFHHMGLARHRAMHRDRKEDCEVTMTNGERYIYEYSKMLATRRG
jgi:hypothetical protein